MSAFNINEDETLSKISRYELSRDEGRFWIEVHEVIAGEREGVFVACPTLFVSSAKQEYIVKSDSAEEALINCLHKIKNVSIDEIFENRSVTQ